MEKKLESKGYIKLRKITFLPVFNETVATCAL